MHTLSLLTLALCAQGAGGDVHFGCGVKLGEVTDRSAVIWTRLTATPDRNRDGLAWPEGADEVPDGHTLAEMRDAVPGAPGEVRVQWWPKGGHGIRSSTGWAPVDTTRDFTHQFHIVDQLRAQTTYEFLIEGRSLESEEPECSLIASFRTTPEAEVAAPVSFTVITGQEHARRDDALGGHRIYAHMQVLDPDFFVHTGDVVYHDKPGPFAKSPALARYKWNRIYSMPLQRSFHTQVPAWFMTDDHDVLKNDCWPGQTYGDLGWGEGLSIFREQTPSGPSPYRSLRWGKDLEVWFVEGREFRSPNNMADGPLKSIWGAEQKSWFFETFAASNATFRVLISSTPVVGPDRSNKKDNHANEAFKTEGDELRAFLASQENAYVICGDRHWQYVSEDSGVREYSCGPTTDRHAGGFSQKNRSEAHRYLKVCGGFLAVALEYPDGEPVLIFRHHAADGSVNHEDVREAG
jgi:alkaline phosphatase D